MRTMFTLKVIHVKATPYRFFEANVNNFIFKNEKNCQLFYREWTVLCFFPWISKTKNCFGTRNSTQHWIQSALSIARWIELNFVFFREMSASSYFDGFTFIFQIKAKLISLKMLIARRDSNQGMFIEKKLLRSIFTQRKHLHLLISAQ